MRIFIRRLIFLKLVRSYFGFVSSFMNIIGFLKRKKISRKCKCFHINSIAIEFCRVNIRLNSTATEFIGIRMNSVAVEFIYSSSSKVSSSFSIVTLVFLTTPFPNNIPSIV